VASALHFDLHSCSCCCQKLEIAAISHIDNFVPRDCVQQKRALPSELKTTAGKLSSCDKELDIELLFMPPHCFLHSAGKGRTQQDQQEPDNSGNNINRCCHSSIDSSNDGQSFSTTGSSSSSNGQIYASHTLSTDANQTVYMTLLPQHFCFLCAKTCWSMLLMCLQVNMLMSNKGTVLRCDVNGKIVMKVFLSGMPDVKLGLNDKLEVCHSMHPFIHSCMHGCMHSFIHSFIHLFIHSIIQSFTHSFIPVQRSLGPNDP
jgi:hypothetical protein